MLKFDKKGLANEIINKLEIELQSAFTEWKKYAMERNNGKFYENFADAEADFALKRYSEGIIATLKANPYMLASSYGTGSLMLDDNPLLQEYKNSDRWNPLRKGKSIVGRKSGTYVNAFGETRKTSGAFAGINIEGRRVHKGKRIHKDGENTQDYYIYPSPPSYALQDAEKFLYTTFLPRAYELVVRNIDFGKFLIES